MLLVGLAGATERDALGRPFQAHWTARMRDEYAEQMAGAGAEATRRFGALETARALNARPRLTAGSSTTTIAGDTQRSAISHRRPD